VRLRLRHYAYSASLKGVGITPSMLAISDILEPFGFRDAHFEALPDSQNTNHVVTGATGERYLLRQHRSASHSLAALESELSWLNHLHEKGLEVQRPVPLITGSFIFVAEAARFSLLTWIEGEVLETIDATRAEVLGAAMARLHVAARDFTPPPGFERPRYDAAFLERTLNELRGIGFLRDDLPLFERATTKAKTGFVGDEHTWGLIHADVHSANLIWRGSSVAIIDFDRCGFGPLSFDIVTALGYLEEESRTAFLRGYETVLPLPEGFAAQRVAFTIAEWLTNLAFLAPRPQEREYVDTVMLPGLREHLPVLLEE
jgi:Ser/Thr protein kinase RdoA (MazF antagonist)